MFIVGIVMFIVGIVIFGGVMVGIVMFGNGCIVGIVVPVTFIDVAVRWVVHR